MHALHLGHVQKQVHVSQDITSKTSLHPHNIGPKANIQHNHLYAQNIDTNFCTSMIGT